MRILIVDDQRLMLDGLKTILELEKDMEVVAVCNDGIEAVRLSQQLDLDIILMDIRMPNLNGVQATKLIKERDSKVKIIILTTFDDDEYIIEGLSNGATGYLLKDIDGDALIQSIRQVFNGNYILPSLIAQKLARRLSSTAKNELRAYEKPYEKEGLRQLEELPKYHFTDRETEIAKMLAEGFTNKQIASALFLSEGTIKNNVSNIYSKIQISDRTTAALFLKKLF